MSAASTLAYQIIVIAKAPVAGKVKTRLCPPLSHETAALLAAASLGDTMHAVGASRATRVVVALDGPSGDWLAPEAAVVAQRGDGLAARITNAFDDVWQHCELPMLLIGMDTPQVTADLLDDCAAGLLRSDTDAVLGMARDGGWWALGICAPSDGLMIGIEMSTDHTGADQLERMRMAGLRVRLLPTLVDVDLIADADEVAAAAPKTRFAAVLAAITIGAV